MGFTQGWAVKLFLTILRLEGVLLMTLYLIIAVAAWSVSYLDDDRVEANSYPRYYPPAPETDSGGTAR